MPVPLKTAPANKPSDYSPYDPEDGPFWTCESDGSRKTLFAETGYASEGVTKSVTLVEVFSRAVKKAKNKIVLRTENMPPLKRGDEAPPALPLKEWKSWTWAAYEADVRKAAKGMMDLGMQQHDSVSIFGFNSPEWFIGAMGAIFAAGKVAGIYPSDDEVQVQYKCFHSNASVAVVEDMQCYNKFKAVIDDLPYLKAIVCWGCDAEADLKRADGSKVRVLTFNELLQLGASVEEAALDARIAKIDPGHACGLIYTSGTTGRPKAVMITHDNLAFESNSAMPLAGTVGATASEERIISYLPLSHVAGLMVDVISPIVITANFKGWMSVNFARPYDLKAGTLGQRLNAVEPTLFLGVPRVWEKIAEKLQAVGAATKGLKKKLSTAAKKRGLEQQMNQLLGGSGKSPSMGPFGIYKKLLGVIKGKLGLKQCKFAFAGAAPMTRELLMYFGSLGINVNEVYGMSECTGATTFSTDAAHEWGTVGFEMPGTEVKIFKVDPATGKKTECPKTADILHPTEAEQGEICFRGRHIMLGYMANPKLGDAHVEEIKKKNAEAIDDEGWLHSGDKGAMSTRGMCKITGRYKELIIGAGGENIAPVPIEDAIKAHLPAVANAMMVGDKRKFNVVLLTLKTVGATGELPGTSKLDGAAKEYGSTIEDAVLGGRLVADIEKALKAIGDDGEVTPSNAARIQKFTILPLDFSVSTGELTATLKLKRSEVMDKYHDIIEALYTTKDNFVPYSAVGSYDVEGEGDARGNGSFKTAGNLDMVDDEDVKDVKESDVAEDED